MIAASFPCQTPFKYVSIYALHIAASMSMQIIPGSLSLFIYTHTHTRQQFEGSYRNKFASCSYWENT